jgi:hypothetical protein
MCWSVENVDQQYSLLMRCWSVHNIDQQYSLLPRCWSVSVENVDQQYSFLVWYWSVHKADQQDSSATKGGFVSWLDSRLSHREVQSQVYPCRSCDHHVALCKILHRVLLVFACPYDSTSASCWYSFIHSLPALYVLSCRQLKWPESAQCRKWPTTKLTQSPLSTDWPLSLTFLLRSRYLG